MPLDVFDSENHNSSSACVQYISSLLDATSRNTPISHL